MQTVEALRKKIDNAKDLQSIVETMKALSAANIWHYERAVESLADYNWTIDLGLHIVLSERSVRVAVAEATSGEHVGAIIVGSDQGMVGRFNEQITSYAIRRIDEYQTEESKRSILAVGLRLRNSLEEMRLPIEEYFSMPGSVSGIMPTVQQLLLRIENWRDQKQLDRIVLFYNKSLSGSSYQPHLVHLLPLDLEWLQMLKNQPWSTRMLPAPTMDWRILFSALIREYFVVTLYRGFTESLASENASRLASMQVAEKNIEDRLDRLHIEFHQQRQRAITEELLDIQAGTEALSKEGG